MHNMTALREIKMFEKPDAIAALLILIVSALAACGQEQSADKASSASNAAAERTPPKLTALPRTPAPEGARVFFISPADGATITNPVVIEFGVEGMNVVKAGIDEPRSGHHHLIIDADLPDMSLPIPASDNYLHFGDASTRTERTLAPGTHRLQLLLGDHLHIPHEPPLKSEVITITVK